MGVYEYSDFVLLRNGEGPWKLVDCRKMPYKLWHTEDNWNVKNKDEQIVVFVFQYKILGDVACNVLAFTEKENYGKRFTEEFDFEKICIVRSLPNDTFIKIADYLALKFGYKKQNIFEESNNVRRVYSELGLQS